MGVNRSFLVTYPNARGSLREFESLCGQTEGSKQTVHDYL